MNIVRLCGGLGNQLFQYAFGEAMRNVGTNVIYDISWYEKKKDINRFYLLNKFKTNVIFNVSQQYQKSIREKNFNLKLIYTDGYSLMGYWQSPLFFQKIESTLHDEFSVKEENYTVQYLKIKREIQNSNSISIHIRRGDYLTHKNHLVLPLEYYYNALKLITSLKKDCEVFVFSDDIIWCKKYFPNFHYVGIEDYLELELMSFCKHNIIANSSFSWWGAYLNNNPNKVVIAPKRWTVKEGDQELVEKKQLILNDWIKL